MKKVKSTMLVVAMIFFVSFINAQNTSFGIRAGFNLANVNSSISTSSTPSFHIGGLVDIGVSDFLSIQPNLLFTGKGYKEEATILGITEKDVLSMYYIELPVLVKAYAKAGDLKIYGAVGPAPAFGIAATEKASGGSSSSSGNVKFGSADGDIKPFDFGIMFSAGIEASGFTAGVMYDLGLSNISHDSNSTVKNRVFGISIGYLFGN